MKKRTIGIREVKSKLSDSVRDVKHGATIVVTNLRKRVARLVPETNALKKRLKTSRKRGTVLWSGHRLRRTKPAVRKRGKRTVSNILVENRE